MGRFQASVLLSYPGPEAWSRTSCRWHFVEKKTRLGSPLAYVWVHGWILSCRLPHPASLTWDPRLAPAQEERSAQGSEMERLRTMPGCLGEQFCWSVGLMVWMGEMGWAGLGLIRFGQNQSGVLLAPATVTLSPVPFSDFLGPDFVQSAQPLQPILFKLPSAHLFWACC